MARKINAGSSTTAVKTHTNMIHSIVYTITQFCNEGYAVLRDGNWQQPTKAANCYQKYRPLKSPGPISKAKKYIFNKSITGANYYSKLIFIMHGEHNTHVLHSCAKQPENRDIENPKFKST